MSDTPKAENHFDKCPQCGKPIETPIERRITQIYSGRVITQTIKFCSTQCGAHYQMGCEG